MRYQRASRALSERQDAIATRGEPAAPQAVFEGRAATDLGRTPGEGAAALRLPRGRGGGAGCVKGGALQTGLGAAGRGWAPRSPSAEE